MIQKDKVILAHDSFTQFGGAERVVKAIMEAYPDSPVYTIATDPKVLEHFSNRKFFTSLIQYAYNLKPKLQLWFWAVPFALYFLKLDDTQIMLSSSSVYAKGFKKPKGSLHIDYCHTPTRFLWNDNIYALQEVPIILRPLAKLYFWWMRKWDLWAVRNVDFFVANSKEVQQRIKNYYNRDSEVIYPFVDVNYWKPSAPKSDYYLIAGRITPYKDYDLIINIFNETGAKLHVVGTGRYLDYLKSIAGPTIQFFGKVSDDELRNQYSGAKAFIYPQVEDFGLMPLEAASCGTPTIALAKAGSLETVVPEQNGLLLTQFNQETLLNAIEKLNQQPIAPELMLAHAQKFSKEVFVSNLNNFIEKKYHEYFG